MNDFSPQCVADASFSLIPIRPYLLTDQTATLIRTENVIVFENLVRIGFLLLRILGEVFQYFKRKHWRKVC